MIVVRACCLTFDDFRRLGNNVLPAVHRDRRPPTTDPATAARSVADRGRVPVHPAVLKFNTLGASPAA